MSDLVGKPEDRFSKDAAHIWPGHKIMTEEKISIFDDNCIIYIFSIMDVHINHIDVAVCVVQFRPYCQV